ncbi:MAG TPA: response regulator, partial [Trueperaceae bacterium]|nr:response regulator [Trueperaceae bacterium]
MSSRQYLIADPDEGQRQLLDVLLADGNSVLVAVETARQALEFLRSNTPSLVVLAQELPDMTGTAVCKRLKAVQRLAFVPVIVTTEPPEGPGISIDLRQEAEQAGVDLLVPKPLGDKALKERSRRLMQEADAANKGPRRSSLSRQQGTTAVIEATLKELDESSHAEARVSKSTAKAGADALASELAKLRDENV